SRDWDRRHDHFFNHHRFHWSGTNWVIIDSGFGYPYDYYPNYYESYPDEYAATYSADTSDSLSADVQRALAEQGYYRGDVDGDVGPLTRNAIASYQRDHRLPVTGSITRSLLDSLGM
ncbi:MAG TPA: peptidoglycan-binding domain-containing protein, partial [Chthoniobacteraceae bacterium]|nr:peptidoglycan-binding domain-containing protein [Chthoniobacteraceae bacterium]